MDNQIKPFPWQDDGTYYPDYDKYGDMFESVQKEHGIKATDYIEKYNRFRYILLSALEERDEEFRKKIEFVRGKMINGIYDNGTIEAFCVSLLHEIRQRADSIQRKDATKQQEEHAR